MNNFVSLVHYLAWPITVLIIAFLFKKDIKKLALRLENMKILGNEFSFSKEIDRFQSIVESVALNDEEQDVVDHLQFSKIEEMTQEVLEISSKEPRLGLVKLSIILEKKIRSLFLIATKNQKCQASLTTMIHMLIEKRYLPQEFISAVKMFSDLRNKIAHGYDYAVSNEEVIRVISIGLELLKVIHEKD